MTDLLLSLWKTVAVAETPDDALEHLRRLLRLADASLLPGESDGVPELDEKSARLPLSGGRLVLEFHEDSFREQSVLLEAAEAFARVLERFRTIRELTHLREAAEAEKLAALARLGRKEIGDEIVGKDRGLRHVLQRVEQVALSDLPVLIVGETGTGKELVARTIHHRSARSRNPFHRVNCGAIPPELIDSQLFGHERGSFTGATDQRKGWFERADGGTLFLDEVGELTAAAQVRLLRILQDGHFERVGGQKALSCDVRIVAATNRDLSQMVAEERFRADLWYRIAVFPIRIPPLRERIEDIPSLAEHFAHRAATRFGLARVHPTRDDLKRLTDYSWPGNVREFGSVIDRAAILGNGRCLDIAAALGIPDSLAPAASRIGAATDFRPESGASTHPYGHILKISCL